VSARNSRSKNALKKHLFKNKKSRGYVTCRYCDRKLTYSQATLDHLRPLSKGGTWAPSNLDFACSKCNSAKGSISLKKFVRQQEV